MRRRIRRNHSNYCFITICFLAWFAWGFYLGCGAAVSGAITWFFENVEAGIILEDDCLADPSFFPFCEEMLARYRDCPQVMHISGNNNQDNMKDYAYSYYFSVYSHIWGWAAWRRSWQGFDLTMKEWDAVRQDPEATRE